MNRISALFTPLELIWVGIYLGTTTALMGVVATYHIANANHAINGELLQGVFTGIIAGLGFIGITWVTIKSFRQRKRYREKH